MIKVRNIHKSFGNIEVLKGIDLDVSDGETIAIIGPSGSGKSTFLRCLNLLEVPQKGTVEIGQHFYDSEHLKKENYLDIRRATAMVFQDYHLFENKNVIKNITLPLTVVKKMHKDDANQLAEELLDRVGLLDKKDMRPSELSGGQQQRVAIARALALKPEIILFDEPTSALDPELVQEVLDVIKGIAKENMTSIIVTHEMTFARDVADRVIFMDGGYIVEQGNAREVITNPQQERTKKFLGRIIKN